MIDAFTKEYRFLSNFAPVEVEYNGIKFPSTEHAYVASKTDNVDLQKQIAKIAKTSDAKSFGKLLKLRAGFDNLKVDIMRDLLTQKFNQEPYKSQLLETADEEIIEGNSWHDTFWGVCHCDSCGSLGKNMLGKLLMEIRAELNGEVA